MTFNKQIEKLEGIIEKLEAGDLEIDKALKLYEEGAEIINSLNTNIKENEGKIKLLTKTLNGIKEENFNE
ncbi:MAG: exodeoxyribonuclease VII small subunit [Firmicutes bacterium]|nr:exodeoxyribonuclease VII small subunit [Bacillota bacterium]